LPWPVEMSSTLLKNWALTQDYPGLLLFFQKMIERNTSYRAYKELLHLAIDRGSPCTVARIAQLIHRNLSIRYRSSYLSLAIRKPGAECLRGLLTHRESGHELGEYLNLAVSADQPACLGEPLKTTDPTVHRWQELYVPLFTAAIKIARDQCLK